jgi:polyisoprenoid-binding protein YceI
MLILKEYLMKKLILLSVLLTALFGQTIDTEKSYVKFSVRNMGIRDVTGTITDLQGKVDFNVNQLDSSYFDVTVNVNTINTNDKKRDAHLKNEDFFETDKWQAINFKSFQIIYQDSIYTVTGDLTIKDVTKSVNVPFNIIETDSTITFIGGEIVNRIDYNIGVDYNNFKIGYDITVEVVCIVNKD